MTTHTTFLKSLAAASANSIATSQAATSGTPLTLTSATVTIDTASSTNTALGRRVLLTSTSGSETASVTIAGINSSGNNISESVTFSGSSTTAQSNLDYVTITSITPTTSPVGNLEAGTNGVGSSAWYTWNWRGDSPMNLGFAVELVSGSVNYTVQYTYDDPNRLANNLTYPISFNTVLNNQAATADSTLSTPLVATRVLINSGTGVLRCRFQQAGIG